MGTGHPLLQIVLHMPVWRKRSTYLGIEIDASVDEDNDKEGLGKNGEEDHDQDDDDANWCNFFSSNSIVGEI